MPPQFQPPFQINPYANSPIEKMKMLNQTISGIGDDWQKYGQNQAALKLQQAKDARERQAFEYDYGPQAQQPQPAQQPSFMQSLFNRMKPQGGVDPARYQEDPGYGGAGTESPSWPVTQSPSPAAGVSQGTQNIYQNFTPQDQGQGQPMMQMPMPIDHTSHFMNWKNSGMPQTYNHPDYQQTPGAPQPQGDMWSQIQNLPGAKRRAEALGMTKERGSYDLQQSEIRKNDAMANMYGGKAGGEDVVWNLDPFTQTWVPHPKQMPKPGAGSSMPATPGGQPSATPSAPGVQPPAAPPGGLDAKSRWKLAGELPKARGAATNTLRDYDTMINEATAIMNDPALSSASGMTSFSSKIKGSPMYNVNARLSTLKAKTLLNVLGSLKSLSSNGSSGFGALSEMEGENIRNSVSSLDLGQGTQALKSSLGRFVNEMQSKKANISSTFKNTYGEDLSGANGGDRIRVRNKATGQTGSISAASMDDSTYERI